MNRPTHTPSILSQATHYNNYISCHPDGPLTAVKELVLPDGIYHSQLTGGLDRFHEDRLAMQLVEFTDESYLLIAVVNDDIEEATYVDCVVQPDKVSGALNLLANFQRNGGVLTEEEILILSLAENLGEISE